MSEIAKNLEALRTLLVRALEGFAAHGQCGKMTDDGREVLNREETERLQEMFRHLVVQAKDASNFASLAAVAKLARSHCTSNKFWVSARRREHRDCLVAIVFLDEQEVLGSVNWRTAHGFSLFSTVPTPKKEPPIFAR